MPVQHGLSAHRATFFPTPPSARPLPVLAMVHRKSLSGREVRIGSWPRRAPHVHTTVPTWVLPYFFSARMCTPQCPPVFSCICSVPTCVHHSAHLVFTVFFQCPDVYTTVSTWVFLYLFSAHVCTPQCPPGFYRIFFSAHMCTPQCPPGFS